MTVLLANTSGMASKTDTDVPDRDEVDGRGQGQGWWLENRTEEALQRWGYGHTITRGYLYGTCEVDAFARGSGSAVAEVKDYEYRPIYPCDLWRLLTIALSIPAKPVLVTNTVLTPRARQICRLWRVRVASTEDVLDADEMPRRRCPDPRLDDVKNSVTWPDSQPEEFQELLDGHHKWNRSPTYTSIW